MFSSWLCRRGGALLRSGHRRGLVSFLQSALSSYTQGWLLYFGLFFVFMILFAPGGIASLLTVHAPALRAGLFPRLVPSYLLAAAALIVPLAAGIALIEMTYHLETQSEQFKLFWLVLDPSTWTSGSSPGLCSCLGWAIPHRAGPVRAARQSINPTSGARCSSALALELRQVHRNFGRTPIINGVDLATRRRHHHRRTAQASPRYSI
jgi:hypothetical protein